MAIINPSDLSFNGEEIREFRDAVFEAVQSYPGLDEFTTVVPGIVAKAQIAFIGHMSKITKKDAGCGSGKTQPNVPMSEKFWDPQDLKIWVWSCWTDFLNTFMVYKLNVGKDKPDLTDTEIFSMFLLDQVSNAAAEDAIRISWFADTAILQAALSGSASVTDYNQLDGFFKQIFSIVAGNSARRVTIAKNAGVTYEAQQFDADDTTNKVATKTFMDLVFKADSRLRGDKAAIILATRSLGDQYIRERLANDNVELAYTRLESGIDTLTILGKKVYIVDQWDRIIQEDFDNGTVFNMPHRAVMSTKANLQIGMDDPSAIADFRVWYSEDLETSNIKTTYKADAKVLQDHMIQVAY